MAMMIDVGTFFIAVIVATIVSFVIGGIWYSRAVFGKMWMAALGKTDKDMEAMRKRAPIGFVVGLIANFIAASILGLFLFYAREAGVGAARDVAGGLLVGFLVWLGFLATTAGAGAIFEGRSMRLVGINLGYQLVSYVVMGLILGIWL